VFSLLYIDAALDQNKGCVILKRFRARTSVTIRKITRCKPAFSRGPWSRATSKRVALCSAIRIYNGGNTRFYRALAASVEIKRAFRARLTLFRLSRCGSCARSRFMRTYLVDVEHFNRIRSSADQRSPSKSCSEGIHDFPCTPMYFYVLLWVLRGVQKIYTSMLVMTSAVPNKLSAKLQHKDSALVCKIKLK